MNLHEFISRIDGFMEMTSSEVIPYFGYFLTKIVCNDSFNAKQIEECFHSVSIPKYSNISAYLARAQKNKTLIRNPKGGYNLSLKKASEIEKTLNIVPIIEPSTNLFPLELLDNTRDYLKKTGRQAILCYDYGLYDGCLVMVRRLLETLIIELFEKRKIEDRIKNSQNNYYFCGDLIDALLKEKKLWTIGRNTAQALPSIKSKGDLSAHNRRFNARKSDIDQIKDGLRITIEELVHLIDYAHP